MIHQLLHLTRPLFVLDTETTGVNPATDRVVELGFQRWEAEGMTKEYRTLVNPGVPIPAESTKVHGITDHDVQSCRELMIAGNICNAPADHMWHKKSYPEWHQFKPWPRFKDLAANLVKGFANCDFAGKHVRFDLRILSAEFARAGVEWSYVGARIVDIDRLEQLAVPRSLSDLHRKYVGLPHDGAHGALSDVRASATVIVKQLERYAEALPRDLDALHQLQWPSFIDAEGTFRFIGGVATVMFGKHRNTAMKDVPTGYWDWLLSADFPADVKRLAAEAKLGRFPEVKV